jgi:hypothetical protein
VNFWYNREELDEKGGSRLKDQVREAMSEVDSFKVSEFPWTSIHRLVVRTARGEMQHFESFDVDASAAFVKANRNRVPEPQIPWI